MEHRMGVDTHPFDTATALQVVGDDMFVGRTSDDYWNFTGPFGGATAATLLRAAMDHPRRFGTPLSFTANFCAPITKGDFRISVREIRSNRSTQHWYMELVQADTGIAATATAVFAQRRASWAHQTVRMPYASAFEALTPWPTQGMMAWMQHYDFRFPNDMPQRLGTTPNAVPASARSQVWISERRSRPLDFLSLLAFADTFFGRIFHVRGAMFPIGTVSMTTYFRVDADDLAANGDAPVFGTADGKIFTKGFSDQTGDLWSRDGRLLATSHQIVYFRAD
jgi:acyl-CoA thioesterase